jgi:hypothetical protein
VVSFEKERVELRWQSIRQPVDDVLGLRAPINVIAKEDEHGSRVAASSVVALDQLDHLIEQAGPAVNITNGVDAHSRGKAGIFPTADPGVQNGCPLKHLFTTKWILHRDSKTRRIKISQSEYLAAFCNLEPDCDAFGQERAFIVRLHSLEWHSFAAFFTQSLTQAAQRQVTAFAKNV